MKPDFPSPKKLIELVNEQPYLDVHKEKSGSGRTMISVRLK